MRISARIAVHALPEGMPPPNAGRAEAEARSNRCDFHGSDARVRDLSLSGFSADIVEVIPPGTLVRLRIPGAGVMFARVTHSAGQGIVAEFVTPLNPARLRMVVGMGPTVAKAAVSALN
jgi:hypothetical protein